MVCSDTHTCSSTASSHIQLTPSTIDLNLKILKFCMWFCLLHSTAFVQIHMLASNLGPTQLSCSPPSHPPNLSIAVMAPENSSFLDCGVHIELVLLKRRPELFHKVFSRKFHPRTQLYVWPYSSCLLDKMGILFFPFHCTDWKNSALLSSGHQSQRASAKTSSVLLLPEP